MIEGTSSRNIGVSLTMWDEGEPSFLSFSWRQVGSCTETGQHHRDGKKLTLMSQDIYKCNGP